MDEHTNETTCMECGKVRTDERDYSPMDLILGFYPGWYSGDDGELCPDCMVALLRGAKG